MFFYEIIIPQKIHKNKENICSITTYSMFSVRILVFNTTFSHIVAVSFIGGGNRKIQKTPPTCSKSLTNLNWRYFWYSEK